MAAAQPDTAAFKWHQSLQAPGGHGMLLARQPQLLVCMLLRVACT